MIEVGQNRFSETTEGLHRNMLKQIVAKRLIFEYVGHQCPKNRRNNSALYVHYCCTPHTLKIAKITKNYMFLRILEAVESVFSTENQNA